MSVNNLISLRIFKSAQKTLKAILDTSDKIKTGTKFLWLNKKSVKYQNKPIFDDEFFKDGLYYFYQLVKPDGDLFSYNEMAIKFKMTPNNHSIIKYVKLILAIPMIWLNENFILSAASNFNEFNPLNPKFCFFTIFCLKYFSLPH